MKLGHVHIKVRELESSIGFYKRLFDLEITEEIGERFAFLTDNEMHHTIALQAKGERAPDSNPASVGLFHIAFEVPDKTVFANKYRQLIAMGITPFTIDHRISWAMYFNDPDGNGLEIYVDTREEEGNTRQWLGRDQHLHKKQILEHL